MRNGARSALGAVLGVALWCATTAAETGNFCAADYRPGVACSGNALWIERLEVMSVIESCSEGVVGEAEVVLRALLSAPNTDVFDVGLFLALDGGSATNGDLCFHSHLAPVGTTQPKYGDQNSDGIPDLVDGPWWDGDGDPCGDIEGNTQAFVTLPPLRIACVDIDGDGYVDLDTVTSWDHNTLTSCFFKFGAYPLSNSRCAMRRVEVDSLPVGSAVSVRDPSGVDLASRPIPNPFAESTRLVYTVDATNARVEVGVFDIAGRRVRALVSGLQGAGKHAVSWDGMTDAGARVPSGVYWIRASVGHRRQHVRVAYLH
jgi:hypothetical protein